MRGFKIEFLILACGALVAVSACNGILHASKATALALGQVGAKVFLQSGPIKETVETKTLEPGDWHKLNVKNEVGKIRVVSGGKTPSLTITKRFHKPENLAFKLETANDTLWLTGKIKTKICNGCGIDITLNIPQDLEVQLQTDVGDVTVAGLLRSLDVTTSVGDIEARNLGTATVHLQTDTGNIDLKDAQGSIELKTDIGTITAQRLGKSQVNMQADTGDLNLTDVEGAVVLETNMGSIQTNNIRGSLNLKTDTGDVGAKNILLEPDSSNTLGTNLGTLTLEDFSASDGIELEGQTSIGELSLQLNGFVVNQTGELTEHQFTATQTGQHPAKVHLQTDAGTIEARAP